MNRILIVMCVCLGMVFQTSCQDEVIDSKASNVELKAQKVQNLVQQARTGHTEAYKSLAVCYRDGDGVEKSYLNAMFMYGVYCRKTGKELAAISELFDNGSPYKLLMEILVSPDLDEEVERKIALLQQLIPAEAKTLIAIRDMFVNKKDNYVLEILKEAEAEGSELAGVLQILYFEEMKDSIGYQECLNRLVTKYPFLNVKIAELYERQYEVDNDFSNIHKAIEHYYKADSYGMLSPRNANKLWSAYSYFGQKDMLEYDENEIERLKKIIKTEKKK